MMIIEAEASRRPRRAWWRRRWLAVAAAVVALSGGVTTVAVIRHRDHVVPLSCACGLSWAQPDADRSRNIDAGAWTAIQAPPRPGHTQAFYVEVINTDSRTQTVLGLPSYYSEGVVEPAELAVAVSTGAESGDEADEQRQQYTSAPQSIAPGRSRWLRFTVHVAGSRAKWAGRSEIWSDLTLRVRVDGDVREETVDFDKTSFVLKGPVR